MKKPVLERMERATPPAVGLFFAFATLMSAAAAVTLVGPGGPLDAIWQVKAEQYAAMKPHGAVIGAGFVLLALICAGACIGSFLRYRWGWLTALTVIAINFAADLGRAILEPGLATAAGVLATVAIIWWLTRRGVRAQFAGRAGAG